MSLSRRHCMYVHTCIRMCVCVRHIGEIGLHFYDNPLVDTTIGSRQFPMATSKVMSRSVAH